MKEIVIGCAEEGQRLDRILHKELSQAPNGFLYRMMRKKNITLNGKKPTGNEKVVSGDVIRIWLADDTLEKFGLVSEKKQKEQLAQYPSIPLDIIYEDENIILVNKPAGMLTQKAEKNDISLNEYVIGYLLKNGAVNAALLEHFRPSVCNRLDRNTSGIVAAGKTQEGLRSLSEMFRIRNLHKYYSCIVLGAVTKEQLITGFLKKDNGSNTVAVLTAEDDGAKEAATWIRPLRMLKDQAGHVLTELEVLLITGRTHQIRAHLADTDHPIIGDAKYGNDKLNQYYRTHCGVKHQLLHAGRLEMPDGRVFEAAKPEAFRRVEEICQIVRPEDYEAHSLKN